MTSHNLTTTQFDTKGMFSSPRDLYKGLFLDAQERGVKLGLFVFLRNGGIRGCLNNRISFGVMVVLLL